MPPTAREDRLVWIDLEMTGLDVEQDVIVEIACIVTDSNLDALDDGIQLVVHQDADSARAHGRLRPQDAHQVRPARRDPDRADRHRRRPRRKCSRTPAARHHGAARRRCAATASAWTAASSPSTCPSSTTTCTTAASTCRRSRSCAGAGTRRSTGSARARPSNTARSATSTSRSRSCATTAPSCSSARPGHGRGRDRRSNVASRPTIETVAVDRRDETDAPPEGSAEQPA